METKFYKIKNEIRILGIDDAPFNLHKDKETLLIGAIMRGKTQLECVLSRTIKIDGTDSTDTIIDMAKKTRHDDLRVIMLDGINFAGFNIADIKTIFEKTGLPVIVVTRDMPDFGRIESALKKYFDDYKERMDLISKAGKPIKIKIKTEGGIYIQHAGIKLADAREILKISIGQSLIPEPVRVAHIIASGIVRGESRGKV